MISIDFYFVRKKNIALEDLDVQFLLRTNLLTFSERHWFHSNFPLFLQTSTSVTYSWGLRWRIGTKTLDTKETSQQPLEDKLKTNKKKQ
jgi:hypothetical protein